MHIPPLHAKMWREYGEYATVPRARRRARADEDGLPALRFLPPPKRKRCSTAWAALLQRVHGFEQPPRAPPDWEQEDLPSTSRAPKAALLRSHPGPTRVDHRQAEGFLIIIHEGDEDIRRAIKFALAGEIMIGFDTHARAELKRLDDLAR